MPCVLHASQRRTDASDESCHSHFPPWKCHDPEWLLAWLRGSKWRNEWLSEKTTPMNAWINEWRKWTNEMKWMKEGRKEWINEWRKWMNKWMKEMNEWMNERNEWMKWMNEMNEWMNECLSVWMYDGSRWMQREKMRPFRLVNEGMSERLDSHSQPLRLFDIAKCESLAELWRATNDSWMNESKQIKHADKTKDAAVSGAQWK